MTERTKQKRLKGIFDGLQDSIKDMSVEELRDDIRADSLDPDTVVRDVREMFASITKDHKQKTLRAVQAEMAVAERAFYQRKPRIPTDPVARRQLYMDVARQHPQFTMQHRDLAGLPDEDIVQTLEQMDALGLLPDADKS